MKSLAFALLLGACVEPAASDVDLASSDMVGATQKVDTAGWESAPTLHEGAHVLDHAGVSSRRVHSLWVAGSNMNHVPLVISARATGTNDIRVAVLGPLTGAGTRPVLAADGYATRKGSVEVTLDVSQPGEHLVVIGSYGLATDTAYDLSATCPGPDGCGVSRYDVFATPKDGALVGDENRIIEMILGDVMVGHDFDVEVELWSSPPMQRDSAQLVATSTASGTQVNAIVPAGVKPGDDLRLVAKTPDGRVLDSGITTRFAPTHAAFARLDSIVYSDTIRINGVAGFFEGVADLEVRSETREIEIARDSVHVDRPGQEGNGFNAFDASFVPDVEPHAGELLSIGSIGGDGNYHRMGCFELGAGERACN